MNTTSMMLVLLFLIVVTGMWQSRKMKNMVHCTYSSSSKQTWDKLVRQRDGFAIFEGNKFFLLPEYGESRYYDKGLSAFFPTKITAYKFRWNSPLPINPNTGEPAMVSPEFMNKLNQGGALLSYAGSQDQALSSKKNKAGGFDKWMPFIILGLVVAVGYCIYMVYNMSADQGVIKQAISDIFKKLGIK